MATKRTKRFLNGGPTTEDEDKAAGLKASAGENVGFFERLRMGNIDDPSSEAYRRFGAGRGRAERAAKVPVEEATATPVARIKAQAAQTAQDEMRKRAEREGASSSGGDASVAESYQGRKPVASAEPATFGAAFKAARNAGDKVFTYKGKSYTTQTKEEAAAQRAKAAPAAKTRVSSNYEDAGIAKKATPTSSQGDEGGDEYAYKYSYPEPKAKKDLSPKDRIAQIPSGSNKPPVEGEKLPPYSEFGSNVSNTIAAMGPGKLFGAGAVGMEMMGAKAIREAQVAAQARKAKLAEELRKGQTPTKFTSKAKPSKATKKFPDRDNEEANIEFKRGGKVSSVSKASRRADGIAQRGKTRGRYL